MNRRLAEASIAVASALAVGALFILAGGGNPLTAYTALLEGALGSAHGWSEVAVKACPLIITGTAVALAFRAGIWNIGAEGQLVAGALLAVWVGTQSWPLPRLLGIPLTLFAAAIGGGVVAAVAAILKVRRGVDEVISTIMLNFIILGLVGYLVHGPLMESAAQYPQTDALQPFARMPRLVSGMRVHGGLPVAVGLVPLCWFLLHRTRSGFILRAVGSSPAATRSGGFNVERTLLNAFLGSGLLAGMAGGIEVSAITHRLYESFSPGYGYTAIAVALLGRLEPWGVLAAGVLFGVLAAGSSSMQRVAGVSSGLVALIQACIIFALAAVEYRDRRRGGS